MLQGGKEDAEKKVSDNLKNLREPDNIDWFMDSIRINKDEFEKILSDPLKHMKYLKTKNPIIRRLKHLFR